MAKLSKKKVLELAFSFSRVRPCYATPPFSSKEEYTFRIKQWHDDVKVVAGLVIPMEHLKKFLDNASVRDELQKEWFDL